MNTLTSKQIAEVVRIGRPVNKAKVSQKFGPSPYPRTQGWYESFGWLGHNGIDYATVRGTYALAVYPAKVIKAYWSGGAGYMLQTETDEIVHMGVKFKLRFYYMHLFKDEPFLVKIGDRVDMGQRICRTGNTGKYTTGAHLHFGVIPYYYDKGRWIKDAGNRYDGAIDPAPMMIDRNWDKLPVDRQYGRKRNWIIEYTFRFANIPDDVALDSFLEARIRSARYVHRTLSAKGRLVPLLTDREANAVIYGSWDLNTVLDPAMFPIWGWYTKSEIEKMKADGVPITTPLIA